MQEMRWQNRYLKSNCIKYRHGHFKVKKQENSENLTEQSLHKCRCGVVVKWPQMKWHLDEVLDEKEMSMF